jgi:phenylalanyl-tRNA synthetase beta chain
MKFTLPWLKEHLEGDTSLEDITTRLTGLGLEVDSVSARGADLSAFVVAEVTRVLRHPDAERLSLCTVETGSPGGPVEVICGAPNVHPGMKAVFAPVGTVIPESGLVLKRAVIRGVESRGMLCSARELLLGDDHTGIIELDPAAPVGTPADEVLAAEGPVIDIELTPNRADCFGVRGIARDLAAAGLGQLRQREWPPVPASFRTDLDITLDFPAGDEAACPLFVGRVFRGVTNRPSPAWLRDRLSAVGLRPISALVDITNLVMLDLNRPLHVFDATAVRGDLVLRFAKPGEELLALDERTYRLAHGMTVIADDSGPLSLGGIMGGESTGVSAGTRDVILEVALFDPHRTAATGRQLGIESDARTRFERGLDPAMVLPGMEAASRLILELCGGEASQSVIAGSVPPARPPFRFRIAQLERLTGITLDPSTIERHLRALGFGLKHDADGVMQLTPPTWRPDLGHEADVVEELVRLHGYDKVPPMPLPRTVGVGHAVLTQEQRMRGTLRRALADRGLFEAITWSFTEPRLAEWFGGAGIRLRNPLNAELSVMRPSVLANLVSAAARNQARDSVVVGLFELGPRFTGTLPGEQEWSAAGLRAGAIHERHWLEPARPVDLFDARADAQAALAAAGLNPEAVRVVADGPEHFHPGRKGRLTLGPNTVLAEFGEFHPAILKAFDLEGPVVGFEVFVDRLPRPKAKKNRTRPPLKASPYPSVERDFAFVVSDDIAAEHLLGAVRSAEKNLIREVALFDVYTGTGLEPGQKSLAVAVRLQAADRTLAEDEIDAVVKKIVAAANKTTGATLRA